MSSSNSSTEVYQKTSNILAAIEQCGCAHCLSILKSGLREPTPEPDADINNPEPPGDVYTSG